MPEGDTILRTAQALDRVLAGHVLVRFEAPRLRFVPFPERTIVEGADAIGKHCLVRFDDGRVLRTHMQMNGSWHLYRTGERWQRSRGAMRAVVSVPEWEAVCFSAPTVELTTDPAVDHPALRRLGPDLIRPGADIEKAVRLLGELSAPDRAIGEALLDQRVAAGIGNIWKNEACFACGVDPFTPVGALDDDDRRRLLAMAARQLRGERGAFAVYGRREQPCLRCGTIVRWAPQGVHRRGTYWCPVCQPARAGT